jgi:hypothetical protein
MTYQVKTGSLTIVASTSVEALRLFDEWERLERGSAFIRDMDGRAVDPDVLRLSLTGKKPAPKGKTMKQILDAIRKSHAEE